MTGSAAQVPPQNVEAEQSALGAMLVAEAALGPVIDEVALRPRDFYLEKHATLYRAIRDLHTAAKPVDPVTVRDELQRRGQVEEAGGEHYVAELADTSRAPGNAKHYAEIVQRDGSLRELIGANQANIESVYNRNGDSPASLHRQAVDRVAQVAVGGGLEVRPADLARVRPTRWLWERRLPLGYLALLVGVEGGGKGTLAAWLVARATRGELPGDLRGEPARVLWIGDEDSFDSVVAARLYAAGADFSMVHTPAEDGEYLDVCADAERLRALILRHGYRLVFFDALLDVLDVGIDDWRSKQVRDALRPLRRVARDVDVALVGALHPNKGSRPTFRDLLSGTHAFNAVSRSSLLLTKHPEDEDRRVVVRGKGNLSRAPRAFEFDIEGRELEIGGHGLSLPVVTDEGESDLSIDDLLNATPAASGDAPTKREALAGRLVEAVGEAGPVSQADALRRVGEGPTSRTGRRALEAAVDKGFLRRREDGRYELAGLLG